MENKSELEIHLELLNMQGMRGNRLWQIAEDLGRDDIFSMDIVNAMLDNVETDNQIIDWV